MNGDLDILNASILIVDDQQSNVILLEEMLRDAGYTSISSTTDPAEVRALHHENHYDLILLDLQMPVMDGFRVMEALKETATDDYLPVLVISAHHDHMLRALASGAKDFIASPFHLTEVKRRIHNMLEVRILYKKLKESNKVLESLALHDELTGLPNRRLLLDRLTLAIAHARRDKRTMAVMYLDLDEFKQINDTLGHGAGDILLRTVAARLTKAVRQVDTVARLAGDEFVIVMWELTHANSVASLGEKVMQVLSQPCSIEGHEVNMTASIGISIYPTHGEEVETLLKNADMALYEAKRSGKNDYRIVARTDALDRVLEFSQNGPNSTN